MVSKLPQHFIRSSTDLVLMSKTLKTQSAVQRGPEPTPAHNSFESPTMFSSVTVVSSVSNMSVRLVLTSHGDSRMYLVGDS
eukprot:6598581-Pyramimonas_sp.AAC.1